MASETDTDTETVTYRFVDDGIGTTAFYEPDLLGDYADPPGIEVQRDDDGVPHVEVPLDRTDAFDADDRFAPYDLADATAASESDATDEPETTESDEAVDPAADAAAAEGYDVADDVDLDDGTDD